MREFNIAVNCEYHQYSGYLQCLLKIYLRTVYNECKKSALRLFAIPTKDVWFICLHFQQKIYCSQSLYKSCKRFSFFTVPAKDVLFSLLTMPADDCSVFSRCVVQPLHTAHRRSTVQSVYTTLQKIYFTVCLHCLQKIY